ncbi:hypothetical protein BKA65DRAFT_292216 [Rhexocercosporidium sp. MPI-PUGE-AT-0058]|nr:hypothetical protein BKA65DRAFT_292216 [Rhexocercosporidium sp. MPI-PUGE-AT-0058]
MQNARSNCGFSGFDEHDPLPSMNRRSLSPGIQNPTCFGQSTVPIGFPFDDAFWEEEPFLIGNEESVEPLSPEDADGYLPPEPGNTRGSACGIYAHNCPYRREECSNDFLSMDKKFRLVEKLSDDLVYKGDSFGLHSYIDANMERACPRFCFCHKHDELPEAFTFIASKSAQLVVTINSDDLYSELVGVVSLEDLQLEEIGQGKSLNGLVLLRSYQTLKTRLSVLRSELTVNSTISSLVSEMELLVDGFLADGAVFKSFGYEDLYEHGFLTFEHWKVFQQAQLQKDISVLDEGFCAIDEVGDFKDQAIPPIHTDSFNLQSMEFDPADAQTDDTPLILSEPSPDLSWNPEYLYLSHPSINETAAAEGREREIRLLLDQGAAVDGVENKWLLGRDIPLVEAAKAGHESVVQLLLDQGAAVDGVENKWILGRDVPLVEAAKAGHESVVQLLLDQGAAVDGVENKWILGRDVPLVEAAKAGHESVVQLLLDQGAAVDGVEAHTLWRIKREVPLVEAAKAGHESVVQLLLDKGAAVNGVEVHTLCGIIREVPVVEAAKAGHESVVQLLLDKGAAVNGVEVHTLCGIIREVPVVEAAKAGHEAVVRLLLDRGAAASNVGLVEAAKHGVEAVARLLLERGITASSDALVKAAKHGEEAVVRSLLDKGVTASSDALVEAAKKSHGAVVRLLLQRGAAVSALESLGLPAARAEIPEKDRKFRRLHKKFVRQYRLMIEAAQRSCTEFQGLNRRFQDRRNAWAAGIMTMRRLCRGRPPPDLDNTIAFLCISKAISETLDTTGACYYKDQFLQDLDRWQALFEPGASLDAYRETIHSMWGVVLDKNTLRSWKASDFPTLTHYQALVSTLIRQTSEPFDFQGPSDTGLECSQQRFRLRNSQILSNPELPDETPRLHCSGTSNAQSLENMHQKPPDPPMCSKGSSLKERIETDISSASLHPTVIVLMAGAIFVIVIIFLRWLRDVSAGFDCSSTVVGGYYNQPTHTLKERCQILAAYLNLKVHFAVPSACPIQQTMDLPDIASQPLRSSCYKSESAPQRQLFFMHLETAPAAILPSLPVLGTSIAPFGFPCDPDIMMYKILDQVGLTPEVTLESQEPPQNEQASHPSTPYTRPRSKPSKHHSPSISNGVKKGPYPCPRSNCTTKPLATISSLGKHLRDIHQDGGRSVTWPCRHVGCGKIPTNKNNRKTHEAKHCLFKLAPMRKGEENGVWRRET